MNSKNDLIGDFNYWPIALQENNSFARKYTESINNILVPVSNIFLTNEIRDLKYVEKYEKVFFLKDKRFNRIYSQILPDAAKNKPHKVKSKLKNAEDIFKDNNYECLELNEYEVLKLASTNKHLFALVKSNGCFFVLNVKLSFEGRFANKIYANKLLIKNIPTNAIDIEFNVLDLTESTAHLVFNLKELGKLYYGVFKCVNRREVVLDEVLFGDYGSYFIGAFGLLENKDSKRLFFTASHNSENSLNEFDIFDLSNFKIKLNHSLIIPGGVQSLSCFRILTQNLNNTSIINNKFIQLVLLNYGDEICMFDIESNKYCSFIGNGNINMASFPGSSGKLNDYSLESLDLFCPINNNCLVFGNYKSQKIYALLSPRLRDLYFLKQKPQYTYEKDYDQSM